MKILLDHCVPRRLKFHLPGHEVETTYERGWSTFKDAPLLDAAQAAFDVLLTTDQNLRHQQNLTGRSMAVVLLVARTNRLDDLLPLLPYLAPTLGRIQPGQVLMVEKPQPSPESDDADLM